MVKQSYEDNFYCHAILHVAFAILLWTDSLIVI